MKQSTWLNYLACTHVLILPRASKIWLTLCVAVTSERINVWQKCIMFATCLPHVACHMLVACGKMYVC